MRTVRVWRAPLGPFPFNILLVLAPQTPGHCQDRIPPDCGGKSLYVLLDLTGHHTKMQKLYEALPPPQAEGHSLLELRDAARRCGLSLRGGVYTHDSAPLERPVIAYLDSPRMRLGHYVVLVPVGNLGTMVQVIDPPYYPRIMDQSDLFRSCPTIRILYPYSIWETRHFYFSVALGLLTVISCGVLVRRVRSHSASTKP
jgi:hypothetical protein